MEAISQRIEKSISNIYQIIDQKNWDKAKLKLSDLDPHTLSEKRLVGHVRGQMLMYMNQYDDALKELARTQDEYGSHIAVLDDINTCHYLLGNTLEWKVGFRKFKALFEQIRSQLKPEIRIRMTLSLGKSLEEMGEIYEALTYYEQELTSLEIEELPKQYYMLLAQILRVRGTFRLSKGFSKIYQEVFNLKDSYPTVYANTEIQHALLVAEIHSVGLQVAETRLRENLEKELMGYDKALFLLDFLEEAISSTGKIPEFINLAFFADQEILPKSLGPYESVLFKIAVQDKSLSNKEIISIDKDLSLDSIIRIFNLLLIKNGLQKTEKQEILKKLDLLLDSISPNSRKLWKRRYSQLQSKQLEKSDEKVSIMFDSEIGKIQIGENSVNLSKKKALKQFLTSVQLMKTNKTEELSKIIWPNLEYNESLYHRMRFTAQRLNKIILPFTGVQKSIIVSPEETSVESTLNLNR